MTAHAVALLRGLHHPSPDDAVTDLKSLVEWLEHTKIRHYAPADRAGLTSPPSDAAWRATFARYCGDVGCPHAPADPATDAAARDWLLGHAVGLASADAGAGLAQAVNSAVADGLATLDAADAAAAAAAPPFDDAGDEATLAAVAALADALGVPAGAPPAHRATAAAALLADRVAPAAALLGAGTPSAAPVDAVDAMLAAVPLGFSTGDGAVDRAAAALRFLYVQDLARLQAAVDAAIGDVQAFTANPKTDTRLGKVGR